MLFRNQESSALKSNRMSLKLAALLLSSLVMMPVAGVLLQKAAAASDLESIQSVAEGDGHFVRIGLNKSIVIRLPAEAPPDAHAARSAIVGAGRRAGVALRDGPLGWQTVR